MNTKYFLFFILLLITATLLSCNNEKSVYQTLDTEFKNCLDSVTGSKNINVPVYMVIPRAGCGGCITSAEVFLLTSLHDPKNHPYIKFILTNFDSEKILKDRYGEYYRSNKLIIDKNNIFNANASLKSIYPTIYFFDKTEKLYKVSACSPSENGIGDIDAYASKLSAKN